MWVFKLILSSLLSFQLAVQTPIDLLNFQDNWNFHNTKADDVPILNRTERNYLQPIYTFAKDLKVIGLQDNTTTAKYLPVFREAKIVGDIIRSKVSCNVCNLGVGLLYREVKDGTPFDEIKTKFVSICVTFKIENFDVCSGIFDTYGPEVIPVLEVISIGPTDICKLLFGELCVAPDVEAHEWLIELPKTSKPALKTAPLPKIGKPVFKVLQISDTHYDLDYVEGAPANCEEPLCCRAYSTLRENEELVPAGKWSSYEKCDAPKQLLENMLREIALQHADIDYILWTGDLPPHDIWNQTKDFNLHVIRDTVEMVVRAFPGTPIFPAIGNHESSPAGNFAPPWMTDPSHSTAWLYREIAESWSKWLPASTEPTVQHGAFYSVLLRPGFRLISINTNYCHSLSWWLLVNSTDPASELKWLIHELQQAENKGQKVHIIGHIAPGSSDCMKSWSKNFYDIVNRFESTITGMFYGHSHADEFEVFYETTDFSKRDSFKKLSRWWKTKNVNDLKYTGRATAVAYLAPSVTSYTNFNPAYRIYYIDGDHQETTREVIEHETWTFDLATANLEANEPHWYKLYSARDGYQMDSLRPKEWDKLIERLTNDEEVFNKFYRYYYRNSPEAPNCDTKCRIQILCDLKSAKSHSRHQLCYELETAFKI